MLISNELELDHPPDELYSRMLDLDGVAPCIPGASLGDTLPDGARQARIEVAFGPMRFIYSGTVRIAQTDPASRKAVLEADATETSGEGAAKAQITMCVLEAGVGSIVTIETDLRVTGGIAQIGRGMIEEVGQELLDEFGQRLGERLLEAPRMPEAQELAGPLSTPQRPAPAPLKLHRLLPRVLRRWLRRRLRGGG